MTYERIVLETFYVAGISVRTSNQNGQSQKDIGELWQRYYSEQVYSQIPDKISEDIYCLYTDYDNDANGAYTTIIGCRVSTLENVQGNLSGKEVPQTSYRCYLSKGKLPDSVLATWQDIWQSRIERMYTTDFDLYKKVSTGEPEVLTYVAVA